MRSRDDPFGSGAFLGRIYAHQRSCGVIDGGVIWGTSSPGQGLRNGVV